MKKLIDNDIQQNKTYEKNQVNFKLFSQQQCTCFQILTKQSSYRIEKQKVNQNGVQSCKKCFLKNLKKGLNKKAKVKNKKAIHRSQSKQPRNENIQLKDEYIAYYDFTQQIQSKEQDISFLLKNSQKKIKNFFSPILKSLKLKRDVLLQNINTNYLKEQKKIEKIKNQLNQMNKKMKPKNLSKIQKNSKRSLQVYIKDIKTNLHKIDLKSLIFPEVNSEIFCRIMNRTYDDFWIEFRKFGNQSSKSDLNKASVNYNYTQPEQNNPTKETANSNFYQSKTSNQKPKKFFIMKQFDEDFTEFRNQREAVVLDELSTNEFKIKLGKLKQILIKKKQTTTTTNKSSKQQYLKQYDSLVETREHNFLLDQINKQFIIINSQRSW